MSAAVADPPVGEAKITEVPSISVPEMNAVSEEATTIADNTDGEDGEDEKQRKAVKQSESIR